MSWLFVFLGFSVLIILHEAGHFFAAKATGMRVERFFLFFGPTLFSVKRGETEYGIKAIPLGGYVKISGMNPEEDLPPAVVPRAYCRQPVWKRIVVIAAGPAVNIALAFVLLFFVAFHYPEVDNRIESLKAGSPAATSVLQPGDRLVSVDGKSFAGADTEERLARFGHLISAHRCAEKNPTKGCKASTPVELGIERGGGQRTVTIYPAYDPAVKRTLVGIEYATVPVAASPSGAVSFATGKMWQVASGTFHVFSHIFESEQRKQISGIVGISDVGHQVVDLGIYPSLLLLALVSLSLGLINLLPILPLDGGHIFWSLVEKLRGRPVSLQVMERASIVGFALVAMLVFIGLSNDVGRITGEGFNVR
ncbi:MAG TPA: site-2 protease family protein [Solirubrobacterales bacterium]|nr:site-2 protease family protein [Solirubrobacterales bacterium]